MGVILDTNAVSDLQKGIPGLLRVLRPHPTLSLPVIVLGEYRGGLRHSSQRKLIEPWLLRLESTSSVLDITASTVEHYADITHELRLAGTPIPTNDMWIAALAREHEMPLATRDAHLTKVLGLKLLAW